MWSHIRRVIGLSVGIAILAGLTSPFAGAQDRGVGPASSSPQVRERVALVIGNSKYDNAPLTNRVNDATVVAAKLRACGFVVNLKMEIDLRGMDEALAESLRELGVQ